MRRSPLPYLFILLFTACADAIEDRFVTIVEEGQRAIVLEDGQVIEVLDPGSHVRNNFGSVILIADSYRQELVKTSGSYETVDEKSCQIEMEVFARSPDIVARYNYLRDQGWEPASNTIPPPLDLMRKHGEKISKHWLESKSVADLAELQVYSKWQREVTKSFQGRVTLEDGSELLHARIAILTCNADRFPTLPPPKPMPPKKEFSDWESLNIEIVTSQELNPEDFWEFDIGPVKFYFGDQSRCKVDKILVQVPNEASLGTKTYLVRRGEGQLIESLVKLRQSEFDSAPMLALATDLRNLRDELQLEFIEVDFRNARISCEVVVAQP